MTALWFYDKVKLQQLVDTTDTGKECREDEAMLINEHLSAVGQAKNNLRRNH